MTTTAASFLADKKIAAQVFDRARRLLPSALQIFNDALATLLPAEAGRDFVKVNFSRLVAEVQALAYDLYLEAEGKAVGAALQQVMEPLLAGKASEDVFDFLSAHPFVLDRLFLSLTQSRRARAGQTFEMVVTTLFQALGYPYTLQPELADSRPDYVLPSIDHYRDYATDCIVFTCKRTLRERWRQVVTEGVTGQAFFLATIDEKLSANELEKMQQNRVIVVVPAEIKRSRYPERRNVVSFEAFFDHYLDSALNRWRANGVIAT